MPVDYEDNPFSSHDTAVNVTCTMPDTCGIPLAAFRPCFLLDGGETGPSVSVLFYFVFCCFINQASGTKVRTGKEQLHVFNKQAHCLQESVIG